MLREGSDIASAGGASRRTWLLAAVLCVGSGAAEAAEKTVPIQREKIAKDGDDEDKPKGRLLPWEPDSAKESPDSGDKELSDR